MTPGAHLWYFFPDFPCKGERFVLSWLQPLELCRSWVNKWVIAKPQLVSVVRDIRKARITPRANGVEYRRPCRGVV